MIVATAGESVGRVVGFLVAAWLIAALIRWLVAGRDRPFLLELPTIAFAVVLAVLVAVPQAANA